MALFDFFKKKAKTQNTIIPVSLVSSINTSLETLCQKSGNFKSSLEEEKNTLNKIKEEAQNFPASDEIFAAKLEQEILMNITAASSACDAVLAGGDTESLKKAVKKLAHSVRQRTELRGDL